MLINIGAQPGAANAVAFVLDRPGVAAWPSWPLIDGQRRISADTALRLARFFGTSERFWINLQSRYDLEIEKTASAMPSTASARSRPLADRPGKINC